MLRWKYRVASVAILASAITGREVQTMLPPRRLTRSSFQKLTVEKLGTGWICAASRWMLLREIDGYPIVPLSSGKRFQLFLTPKLSRLGVGSVELASNKMHADSRLLRTTPRDSKVDRRSAQEASIGHRGGCKGSSREFERKKIEK